MTDYLRLQEQLLEEEEEERSCGPAGGKGQGPEPRGGVEQETDHGATVSLIIRTAGSEEDSAAMGQVGEDRLFLSSDF